MDYLKIVGIGLGLAVGCGDGGASDGGPSGEAGSGTSATASPTSGVTSVSATGGDDMATTAGSTGMFKFDVLSPDSGQATGGPASCKVVDDMSGTAQCTDQAPANSFDPVVQWEWQGADGFRAASATPLVANLTDDDGNDEIDLCDIPDVVVVAWPNGGQGNGSLFVLSGDDGSVHWRSTVTVNIFVTPAIGDIDGDLRPEIVTMSTSSQLIAFNDDGSTEWVSTDLVSASVDAVALADVDGDGDVEILMDGALFDHNGNLLWDHTNLTLSWSANAIADLDGDDTMEIIIGAAAWNHDGTPHFPNPGLTEQFHGLYPQIADLDDDDDPEILVSAPDGLALLEHDGTLTWSGLNNSGDSNRPVAIHDFDGDGEAEFAASFPANFVVYEANQSVVWTAAVADPSGQAGGTAFDFLGAGLAQAMYADEFDFFAFDDMGAQLMSVPRTSLTQTEYPVVADVDNDGSAEVVVVSNPWAGQPEPSTVQVIRDAQDRWIPARRIWNQHTYHVTNVREDGTIPEVEPKSWTLLNTFRTQAQISAGGVCQPEPAG